MSGPSARPETDFGIYLYWIPLGAGGSGFVRMNGRAYEAMKAYAEGRPRRDLYHTALEVRLPEGRFIVETMWPLPDGDTGSRGVVVVGPVFAKWLAFTRLFRYEVRCWREGTLPDAGVAVGGPRLVSGDIDAARRLLANVGSVPAFIWGRDQSATGDMWNSNSVISWLLSDLEPPAERLLAPTLGRAPGWEAGIAVATSNRRVRS